MVEDEGLCFLCLAPCYDLCPHCKLVHFCSQDHLRLHRHGTECLPYKAGRLPDKGRVLFATRDLKPLDLILIDPGTVVGPNYKGRPVCLECLKPVEGWDKCPEKRCSVCQYPVCGPKCAEGARHQAECKLLAGQEHPTYAPVTPLRMLLLQEGGGDRWLRTNQLMDHLEDSGEHPEEWEWYDKEVRDTLRDTLHLGDRYSASDIRHAIGLLNVNAVCLQFPKICGAPCTEVGKGCYPIFAIMSHHCVCNARYFVNPATFNMYVRARVHIKAGEELTVQYLSALNGNHRRRQKIREEWYFDCSCRRCSDPTECGSFISAVRCFKDCKGYLLPEESLDYQSLWQCSRCKNEVLQEQVANMVESLEQELNSITDSGDFAAYQEFLTNYSGTLLHPNHFLLTTARRNLIQFLCYSQPVTERTSIQELRYRVQLCRDFHTVLAKIDPGWSELSMFALRELHFTRLSLLQAEQRAGRVGLAEYSVKNRDSLEILRKIEEQKKVISFANE